jgi:hypothetical protein
MSFAVSGASTVSASDTNSGRWQYYENNRFSVAIRLTGLTAGSNTFTAKYRKQQGTTAGFSDRDIIVIDLGS